MSPNVAMNKYLNLLGDPCSAEMVRAPYLGTGSGYLMRTKQLIFPTGSTGAVDFVVEIHPVTYRAGGGVSLGNFGYSTTAGGSLGAAAAIPLPAFLVNSTTVSQFRPVAGCAKVVYNGSEMNRSGQIATSLYPGYQLDATVAISGTAVDYMNACQRRIRLGNEAHEVRWVPDQDTPWCSYFEPTHPGTVGTYNPSGSTILVVGSGVPAASCAVELTFVWEWTPPVFTSGLSLDQVPPPSFTLNSALSKIGNLVEFATSPEGLRRIQRFAQGVYNTAVWAPALLT